ncbi:hypothetical protein VKT23_013233 [Stygiomarasmius scandens]|uniref:FAD-binding domain-containing protein n=1 Tax=Marasmiellus scandens TaxID=2682957 RepID=A0ABR1J8T7_9AGAR
MKKVSDTIGSKEKIQTYSSQLNIPYTIFEQDEGLSPASRPRDWSFGVYWAQSRLGECLPLGVDENYLREHAQVDGYHADEDYYIPSFNGQTGEMMKKIPAPYSIRLARKKFLEVLVKQGGGVGVKYGKRLSGIKSDPKEGTVTASFEDSTEEQGGLLIGCDGPRSKVREFLLGTEKAALRVETIAHLDQFSFDDFSDGDSVGNS